MTSVYDEVELEDFTYIESLELYHYPCPCGDRFEITLVFFLGYLLIHPPSIDTTQSW